jgi:hypothetical protein
MLKDLLLWWKNTRMDVLGGWNSEIFDVTYLVNRMINVLGEAAAQYLSPWRDYKPRTVIFNNKEKPTYDLSGLACTSICCPCTRSSSRVRRNHGSSITSRSRS